METRPHRFRLLSTPQKFDYDSSSVRKRFFREALLQIFIPYMLKQLGPSCVGVSPGRVSTSQLSGA